MRRKSDHMSHLQLALRATYDVALIVILFLIATGKLRDTSPATSVPIHIQLPPSVTPVTYDLDGDRAIIYYGFGKVMLSLPDTIRKQTLIKMDAKYHLHFSSKEITKFKTVGIIGVPMDSLRSYIANYYNEDSYHRQIGIRMSANDNELANWINESSQAYKTATGSQLHFYIYADQREEYPSIKRIFDILEDQGIYKWSLITWSKSKI
jgi:hypothetical protein